jgi:signal transduction histidine kinase
VWQIVTVPAIGVRFNDAYVPLLVRSGLILICAATAAGLERVTSQGLPPSVTVVPALLLLGVGALASLPMPAAVPRLIPLLAEALTAAVIVGAMGRNGVLFLLYLLVPLFIAGVSTGIPGALACAGVAVTTLVAASFAVTPPSAGSQAPEQTSFTMLDSSVVTSWVFIFLGVGMLGAWVRRIRNETAPDTEPAYADAHRLLSELHVVARQLSLGLDPRTLALALAEDIRAVVPSAVSDVLARSPGGRFVALVGDTPDPEGVPALEDAWLGAEPVRREGEGRHVTAVPVLMGEQVVALVAITTGFRLDDQALDRCQALIAQSGPRLASAMLFDDVRRLATTDERMRLAREIHDGIAQDLASVGYALDDIRRDSDPAIARQVLGVREQLRAMIADLRMSIFDLRTGIDDTVGLGTALSEHAQRIGAQSDLAVHVSIDESPRRLPISVEMELLRIVQEAIANVRRHARARNLWLSVTVEPPRAHITVTDDGQGLRPGRPDSFGITGMRERARRIGARFAVGAGPGGGTTVEVALGTEVSLPADLLTLPRSVVTRMALTDPRGIPAIAHAGAAGQQAAPSTGSNLRAAPGRPTPGPSAGGGTALEDQEVTT